MKVVVCIKRVPDTETHIRISETGTDIDTRGVKYIISPYDEFAIEAGLRVKEDMEGGEVSLLTVGASEAPNVSPVKKDTKLTITFSEEGCQNHCLSGICRPADAP